MRDRSESVSDSPGAGRTGYFACGTRAPCRIIPRGCCNRFQSRTHPSAIHGCVKASDSGESCRKYPHVLKHRRLKKSSGKTSAAGFSGLKNLFRAYVRSVFQRIFHCLLGWLGIRRLREHSFFATLLARPASVADFGAHRGEFFAALKSEHSISRAPLIEADPGLAESLKQTFGDEADVVKAAAVAGANSRDAVMFTRSTNPESSSILKEWSAAYGIADQVKVPRVNLWNTFAPLGGRIDLIKMDVEGAEIGILQNASVSDLASCGQLTVEFHDRRPPLTRRDVDDVCRRMCSEGYGIVKPNWPHVDDVLFVNLKSMRPIKRIEFRCRMAVANALFVIRRRMFATGYS